MVALDKKGRQLFKERKACSFLRSIFISNREIDLFLRRNLILFQTTS